MLFTVYSLPGEFSTEDDLLKDPYALTLHFVTDPGRSIKTKNLIKPLIKWFDPSFKLFNIAERSKPNGFQGDLNEIERDVFPALSVMLFLNHDGESTENKVEETQEHLTRKPWRYHHHAATPTKVYLCEPNNQNFYTTEHEMRPFIYTCRRDQATTLAPPLAVLQRTARDQLIHESPSQPISACNQNKPSLLCWV